MDDESFFPDFSGDDFANDKDIQQYRENIKRHQQMVQDSLKIIRNGLELHDGSHKDLKDFLMFKELKPIVVESMNNDNLHVSMVEYYTEVTTPRIRNYGTDEYLFGLIATKISYPKPISIRKH
ncbi:MAG: hypothetical protein ACTHMM_27310 [Agriterribacter sp.]